MKSLNNFVIGEEIENNLYLEHRMLFEKVSMSKKDFVDSMAQLYDMGNDEAIARASSISADIQVEETIDRIFDTKAPKSAKQNREKLALEIRKLKIPAQDKVKLAQGIEDGKAYDIEAAIAAKNFYSLKKMVDKSYVGADKLLRWFVEWDASPDSGNRGKASTELFFILASKNGSTPSKGDAVVNGTAVEIKSYKSSFSYEFTVNGQQGNGFGPRNDWISLAKKLYKQKKLMKYWYPGTPFGFVIGAVPAGGKKFKLPAKESQPGKNYDHLSATMSAFCYQLQESGGMSWQEINGWIIETTAKVFGSRKYPGLCWNGKEFDSHAFLMVWNCCALDYYKKEEGFDVITSVNKSSLSSISFASGAQMWKFRKRVIPDAISNEGMPGQNNSVAAGTIR